MSSEEDQSLEQIKAAWNHSVAWDFDTPEKAEAHVCDPKNPDCAAYLYYLNPEHQTPEDRGRRSIEPMSPMSRKPLGVQVTIVLEPEMAERLREVARKRDRGYVALLREWIEERLLAETD